MELLLNICWKLKFPPEKQKYTQNSQNLWRPLWVHPQIQVKNQRQSRNFLLLTLFHNFSLTHKNQLNYSQTMNSCTIFKKSFIVLNISSFHQKNKLTAFWKYSIWLMISLINDSALQFLKWLHLLVKLIFYPLLHLRK